MFCRLDTPVVGVVPTPRTNAIALTIASLSIASFAVSAGALADTILPAVKVQADTEQTATGPVQGYVAKRTRTGTKSDTALIEVPQSISIVTRDEMDDRNVQSMPEAVAYSAGVRTESAGIDSRVDDISIRGFDAGSWNDSMYLDGIRVPRGGQWTTPQVDAYGLERVEVVKGPAAVLYGQVTPGGLVNMVSKRPSAESVNEVLLQAASHDQYKVAFDVGGPLDGDGRWLGRLVASHNDGDSQIDETALGRTFVAPSLTFAANDDTQLTLLAYHQKDRGGSTFQFLTLAGTYFPTQYGRIDRDTFIGEPEWNDYEREQMAFGYELTHRFNDSWTFEQNAKYTEVDSFYRTVVTNTAGTPFGLQPDNRTVRRRAVQGDGELYSIGVDSRLRSRFATGMLQHELMFGVDYLLNDWTHLRSAVTAPITPIDVYAPVYGGTAGFAASLRPQSDFDTRDTQVGVYLQDMVSIDRWRVTLGVRRDRFDNEQLNRVNGVTTELDDDATTWRGGVTYLLDNGVAPYLSYATSFQPESGVDTALRPFEPTEGKQVEIGVKYQPVSGSGTFTAALFDLRQENLVRSDNQAQQGSAWCFPAIGDNTCQRQIGETRTRGVELEGKLWLAEGLSLSGSYTWLDTEVIKSSEADKGKRLTDVPEHAAALWLDYQWRAGVLAGASAGVGARHVGSAFGDELNDYEVDSYTLFDAAIRYDLTAAGVPGLLLALSASNLTDEEYFTACTGFGCSYGSARNVVASVKYRW